MLTDDPASGDPVIEESYRYDEYGEAYVYSGSGTARPNGSDYEQDYLYTGRRWDPELEMYYYRARYYHQELGVFGGRDPAGPDRELNRYSYVGQLPVGLFDPLGTQAASPRSTLQAALSILGPEIKSALNGLPGGDIGLGSSSKLGGEAAGTQPIESRDESGKRLPDIPWRVYVNIREVERRLKTQTEQEVVCWLVYVLLHEHQHVKKIWHEGTAAANASEAYAKVEECFGVEAAEYNWGYDILFDVQAKKHPEDTHEQLRKRVIEEIGEKGRHRTLPKGGRSEPPRPYHPERGRGPDPEKRPTYPFGRRGKRPEPPWWGATNPSESTTAVSMKRLRLPKLPFDHSARVDSSPKKEAK